MRFLYFVKLFILQSDVLHLQQTGGKYSQDIFPEYEFSYLANTATFIACVISARH